MLLRSDSDVNLISRGDSPVENWLNRACGCVTDFMRGILKSLDELVTSRLDANDAEYCGIIYYTVVSDL